MEPTEASAINYGLAPPPSRRFTRVLAIGSIALALIGFPAGVITTIITRSFFSHDLSERSGFMLFATLEGAAIAAGVFAAFRSRRGHRTLFHLAIIGTILGVIGSAAVLMLIYRHAIR